MKARLCDSLVCATCSLVCLPPRIAQSSLQSNWNASPGANTSGTKVPRPLVCCFALPLGLPGPHEGRHAAIRTVIAQHHKIGVHLLGRAPLLARLAGLDPQPTRQLLGKRVQLARPIGNLEPGLHRLRYADTCGSYCATSPCAARSPGSASHHENASAGLRSIKPCRSLQCPPTKQPGGRSKHGSLLSGNLCPSRVNSQWKSTPWTSNAPQIESETCCDDPLNPPPNLRHW